MIKYRLRILAVVVAFVGVILLARWGLSRSTHTTPAACLEAYREARAAGDAAAYLGCLGEPLLLETRQRFPTTPALAEALRIEAQELKSWVEVQGPQTDGDSATVEVEEIQASKRRRVRFHLERSGGGWLIMRIERLSEEPLPVPHGTPAD